MKSSELISVRHKLELAWDQDNRAGRVKQAKQLKPSAINKPAANSLNLVRRVAKGKMNLNDGLVNASSVLATISSLSSNSIIDINEAHQRAAAKSKATSDSTKADLVNPTSKFSGSFNLHLARIERWGNLIGLNLLSKSYHLNHKGHWKADGHNVFFLWLVRLFLILYLVRELCSTTLIDVDDDVGMLYIGDFSNIYGIHVDRFAYTAFKFCWGLHAFIIYIWITRNNGKARKWLMDFESRWLETSYCVNKELEGSSLRGIEKACRFMSYFIKGFTTIATGNIVLLSVYGFYNRPAFMAGDSLKMSVYIAWSIVHIVWFWMTFVINLTAFGHHYMLCKGIHIRFDETKQDLDFTILSDWSSHTEPEHISKLIAKHYFVCDMVKQANKHLKIYLFVFYIIFAPHLCLMIYQILFANSTTQGRIFIGFLLIISDAFQVYFVSVLSAQITSKSHEPYYAMHGINRFNHLPEDVQLQSTLFMQRLSNTVVGLTILDSFVLTGGLISSLITAIVTYFSVILESS